MKKAIIGVVILLILVAGAIIFINNNDIKIDKPVTKVEAKMLHLYHGNYLFDVEIKEEKINITRFEIVQCIQAPCDPIKDRMFSVILKEEYSELFNKIFSDGEKEKTIYSNEMNSEDRDLLLKIVGEKKISNSDKYEIIKNVNDYDSNYYDRGYYLEVDENGNTIITIAMGMRNTGGYSIEVEDIIIKNKDILIYVRESSPPMGSSVTMAITYPITKVKLLFNPNKIEIQDVETFKKYEKMELTE